MKEEQDIDKIFRQKLGDPVNQTAYREDDWNALEQLLDKNKKRRGVIYWLPVLSSVAAILLLVLGWWLFKPQASDGAQKPTKQLANVQQLKKQQAPNIDEPKAKNNIEQPVAVSVPQLTKNSKSAVQIPAQEIAINKAFKMPKLVSDDLPVAQPVAVPGQNTTPELLAVNRGLQINSTTRSGNVSVKNIITNDYAKSLAANRNKVTTTSSFSHPQFALTVMGAPDINGVNSFQQTKTGTNVGLLFSVGFNKLTVTTGVTYSYKPYNVIANSSYQIGGYTFRNNSTNVLADCRMLDIPINIDYQLFNKNQNKISIGTGISSYIMLKESYSYEYANAYGQGSRNFNIASPGKYLFGIMNLQATYTRQVNAKVGVSVQPYFKLPLGEVGASEVKLQSAGVAIGLSWNINSLTKP
jgi:hypothetical protein